jgi:hypothetical protein
MKTNTLAAAVCAALSLSATQSVANENTGLDVGRMAIAGYGDVTYMDMDNGNNSYNARFTPIFLFQLSEKIHIESELEFSIDENGETQVEMEYADLHYFFNDNTVITAGKFLLPFGQFGPNLHPSWINKLPAVPGIYGHGGNGLMTPLLPVLSDVGFNIRNSWNLGDAGKLFTDFYVVQGPSQESDAHGADGGHDEAPVDGDAGHDAGIEFPAVEFEYKKGDNNDSTAFGGRIAYAFLPEWEIGFSFYNGAYSNDGDLRYKATNIDINWIGSYASVRGEIINTTTDGEHEDGDIEQFDRNGWYVQGVWQARQLGKAWLNPVEIVLRHSEINDYQSGKRTTFGIDYWLEPSAALKVAFEDTELDDGDSDNRVFVQLAFGF